MKILITGGAGYIGSHTAIELLNQGHQVIIVDNLSNSKIQAINKIEEITKKKILFYEIDLSDEEKLQSVFDQNTIDAAIHFAGYKAVGESVEQPLRYYHNNLMTTLTLCRLMQNYKVFKLVFSSSATVYDTKNLLPFREDMSLLPNCPYGKTKWMIEEILQDLCAANQKWRIGILRYFNPAGAHPSGDIGEDPHDIPNNLMPFITQVASKKRAFLEVFGNDYDTPDGTGIRDYIHVTDLAKGHLKALHYLSQNQGIEIFNLGSGKGYSVLEMISAFEQSTHQKIPYQITARRAGDIASCFADVTKAETLLQWKAEKTIEDICRDAWHWQKKHPNGF